MTASNRTEPPLRSASAWEDAWGAAGSGPLASDEALARHAAGAPLAVPRDDIGPLRVTGADRADFLHGQISSAVRGRAPGTCSAGLLLDHRGHARAELVAAVRDDDLYVAVVDGAAEHVQAELQRHIIFDQVELAALPETLASLTLLGAEEVLPTLGATVPDAGRFVEPPFEDAKLLVHRSRWAPGDAVTVHVLRRQLPALLARLAEHGVVWAPPEALTALRVAAGIPVAPSDAGSGVLPQESGLEPLVDYRKGCYLGQEIMARIEARGRLKRSLHGLRLEPVAGGDGAEAPRLPAVGAALEHDGRTVGRLGTAVRHPDHGWIALAVLRDGVGPAFEIDGWRAKVAELPFDRAAEGAPLY